ncbi:hypothetical protein L2E82_08600 [Cichorium intybus]|uniref:Uncharacterized protein n=1 Tax=Cichorium intybus TaxID=13427 RepID=A0ACB9G6Q6_CICIN|nr:hypothetical protein L2E82_08600 [Cichorium intybus]
MISGGVCFPVTHLSPAINPARTPTTALLRVLLLWRRWDQGPRPNLVTVVRQTHHSPLRRHLFICTQTCTGESILRPPMTTLGLPATVPISTTPPDALVAYTLLWHNSNGETVVSLPGTTYHQSSPFEPLLAHPLVSRLL